MKLRFGIDASELARIRGILDERCDEPPVGRRLSYVYLDTPDGALAEHGMAIRFRRVAAIGAESPRRPWRYQTVGAKGGGKRAIKKLGIKRLQQRLGATFDIRIERWTWAIEEGWAAVSLDTSEVSTGGRHETFAELRVVCKKSQRDAAMDLAVGLGATHLASVKARDRGRALLDVPRAADDDPESLRNA